VVLITKEKSKRCMQRETTSNTHELSTPFTSFVDYNFASESLWHYICLALHVTRKRVQGIGNIGDNNLCTCLLWMIAVHFRVLDVIYRYGQNLLICCVWMNLT